MTTVRKKQITQELKESEQKEEVPTTTVPDSTSNDEKADDKAAEGNVEAATEKKAAPEKKAAATKKEAAADKKDDAPVQNGDGEGKAEEPVVKTEPKKKVIPSWATLPKGVQEKNMKDKNVKVDSKVTLEDEVVNAIKATVDSKGVSSVNTIRRYLLANVNPDMKKFQFKKAVEKALNKNKIKQVSGKGISGSFRIDTPGLKKATAAGKKGAKGAKAPPPTKSLEDIMPDVFTWISYPKEASLGIIKKYIGQHYPDLNAEGEKFKEAVERSIEKGQLKRITGKGMSGTVALVDGADKTGTKFEDPIESAIIAMNEPKECSVNKLRDYLSVYHNEYNTDNRPLKLKNCLDSMEAKGWMARISGKGFSGTFRLMYPYYPSPSQLWGDELKEDAKKAKKTSEPKSNKRKVTYKDSSDEESSEEEEDESDDEVMPTPAKRAQGKRPLTVATKYRASNPPPPKKIKASKGPASKKKKAAAAKKQPPAKKAAGKKSAAKKPAAKKAVVAKKSAPAVKKPVARKSRA